MCSKRRQTKRKGKTSQQLSWEQGTTSKFQLKQLYSCLSKPFPHALSHCLQHTTAQLQYFPSLLLPFDSCISIIGHPILFFPTLSVEVPNECIFIKYYEFLGDSVILQNLSLTYFPISTPVLTAYLKLPRNFLVQLVHSVHPCPFQDRYRPSFWSHIHRSCSEIFSCVSN